MNTDTFVIVALFSLLVGAMVPVVDLVICYRERR